MLWRRMGKQVLRFAQDDKALGVRGGVTVLFRELS